MLIYKRELITKSFLTEISLGVPENYRKECIKEIYRLGDSMNNTTNIKGIMTNTKIWEESSVFNTLISNITKVIEETKDGIFNTNLNLEIETIWGAIYKKGHYTLPHRHMSSSLSFVYYLQGSSGTPIVFSDNNVALYPKDDLLLIFPSFVLHHVPKHEDIKDRIVLAGNMILSHYNN
tara:strand:+ start:74 stop:607 length:534 start_codon:yes stop_codon:yes gene_type:complete